MFLIRVVCLFVVYCGETALCRTRRDLWRTPLIGCYNDLEVGGCPTVSFFYKKPTNWLGEAKRRATQVENLCCIHSVPLVGDLASSGGRIIWHFDSWSFYALLYSIHIAFGCRLKAAKDVTFGVFERLFAPDKSKSSKKWTDRGHDLKLAALSDNSRASRR